MRGSQETREGGMNRPQAPINVGTLVVLNPHQPPLVRTFIRRYATRVGPYCWVVEGEVPPPPGRVHGQQVGQAVLPEQGPEWVARLRDWAQAEFGVDVVTLRHYHPLPSRKPEVSNEAGPRTSSGGESCPEIEDATEGDAA